MEKQKALRSLQAVERGRDFGALFTLLSTPPNDIESYRACSIVEVSCGNNVETLLDSFQRFNDFGEPKAFLFRLFFLSNTFLCHPQKPIFQNLGDKFPQG